MNYPKNFGTINISDNWYSYYVPAHCFKYILREYFENALIKDFYKHSDKLLEKILGKPSYEKWIKNNGR